MKKMTGFLYRAEDSVRLFLRENAAFLFTGILLGTLTYFLLMSNELVNNYDGIWHPSSFIAGDWEIALGRPFERYADRARFGIVSSSLNCISVFFLIAAGDALILKKLGNTDRFAAYLLLFLTIANPLVGELLSYYYLAVNYAFAWFFAVLAFVLADAGAARKETILRALAGGLALSFSMCFYQAYLGVTAVLFLLLLLKRLKTGGNILGTLAVFAGTILSGGVFYLLIVRAMLSRAGVALASYKGADEVSLPMILLHFPASLIECYRQFGRFLFFDRLDARLEFSRWMVIFLAAAFLFAAGWWVWRLTRVNPRAAIFSAVILVLLPPAACAVLFLAVGNSVTGLMAMGILIVFPGFYLLLDPSAFCRRVCTAALCVTTWYMLHAVSNDQLALKEGMNATMRLTNSILRDIYEGEAQPESRVVAFVGRAAENPLFAKSVAYETANEYAQFGRWSTEPRNNRATWYGITWKLCGTAVNLCPEDVYAELIERDEVAQMPVYPAKGSIAEIDGITVVRVSDLYR